MPKEASTNFEIPAEMRNFAEKSMEQAKQAFDSFVAATQEAVNTVESRAANARTGVKDVVTLPCALPSATWRRRSNSPSDS